MHRMDDNHVWRKRKWWWWWWCFLLGLSLICLYCLPDKCDFHALQKVLLSIAISFSSLFMYREDEEEKEEEKEIGMHFINRETWMLNTLISWEEMSLLFDHHSLNLITPISVYMSIKFTSFSTQHPYSHLFQTLLVRWRDVREN